MVMRQLLLTCCLVVAAGCRPGGGSGPDGDAGPGRFPHAAIYRTSAPWDGPATQLFLSEAALKEGIPPRPYLSVRVYKSPDSLANQRVQLGGTETREGQATWIDADGHGTPVTAEVEFGEVREGSPVTGKYAVTFPDGRKERGRFEAARWKSEAPGG